MLDLCLHDVRRTCIMSEYGMGISYDLMTMVNRAQLSPNYICTEATDIASHSNELDG